MTFPSPVVLLLSSFAFLAVLWEKFSWLEGKHQALVTLFMVSHNFTLVLLHVCVSSVGIGLGAAAIPSLALHCSCRSSCCISSCFERNS